MVEDEKNEIWTQSAPDPFDASWYSNNYPDVNGSGMSPQEHWRKYGGILERVGSPNGRPVGDSGGSSRTLKVSVICLAYNHERYIRDAINGFLMQECDFSVEFLIADDRSTDGTAQIIQEFAQEDARIVAILRDENLGPAQNFFETSQVIRGEYVALCEGDDYWTDPLKLRTQVRFLEDNRDISICFHPVRIDWEDNIQPSFDFPTKSQGPFDLKGLARRNYIQTNSVMYRWRFHAGLPADYDLRIVPGDWHLHLLHAEVGGIGFIDKLMGVYRKHTAGMWAEVGLPSHRQKYAVGELAFFADAQKRFGGFFNDIFNVNLNAILSEVIENCLLSGNCNRLYDFYVAYQQEFRALFPNIILCSDECMSPDTLWECLKRQTRVSVIVLCYNHATSIVRCIEGILKQEGCFEMEIIIGDDASTDATVRLIMQYFRDERLNLVKRPINLGFKENLRDCLSISTGDYIAFCEGDDYWLSKSKVQKQVFMLNRNVNIDMVFNWILLHYEEGARFVPHEGQSQIVGSTITFSQLATDNLIANFSACMYRSAAILQIPDTYFRTEGAADWLLNLYIAYKSKIGFLRELLSVYFIHKAGMWAGTSVAQQKTKIMEAKSSYREIFGRSRGFDKNLFLCRIQNIEDVKGLQYNKCLDAPNDGSSFIADGAFFTMRGWAFDPMGAELRVLVKQKDGRSYEYSCDRNRPDVVESPQFSDLYLRSNVGFEFEVELRGEEADYEIALLDPGGSAHWWYLLNVSLV